jgi:hypothetical protein
MLTRREELEATVAGGSKANFRESRVVAQVVAGLIDQNQVSPGCFRRRLLFILLSNR